MATIPAGIRALVPAGSLQRTDFDKKLGSRNRTLLVSFGDKSFFHTCTTSHVHVVLPSSPKVARFEWDNPAAPSIAITFKNTAERDTAKAIIEASNLRGDQRHLEVAVYCEAAHRNVIWSLACKRRNLSRLHATLMAMLPYTVYVPVYRLTEHEKKKGKGLVVKTVGTPSWLLKLVPPSTSGYEWRISGSSEGDCHDCPREERPNEVLTLTEYQKQFQQQLAKPKKHITFNRIHQIQLFEVFDEEDEEDQEEEEDEDEKADDKEAGDEDEEEGE